jgi:hypothetical protein
LQQFEVLDDRKSARVYTVSEVHVTELTKKIVGAGNETLAAVASRTLVEL